MDWRRAFLALAITGAAVAGLSGPAHAQCPAMPNLPTLQVEVKLLQPKVVYHHDVDLFGLPSIQHGSERPPPGAVLSGLTKLVDQFRAAYREITLPVGGDHVCVWLVKVDAELGDRTMDVYIAENYPPGSCEYDITLAHENTHMRFNLEALHDWLPKIRAAVTDTAKRKFPASFLTRPSAEQLNAFFLDSVAPVFDQMNRDMAKRNGSIDTPENYRRETAKCHNWMRHANQ